MTNWFNLILLISSETNSAGISHPLLAPCLRGLGKFSHLIDLDFMGDLIKHLKQLASNGSSLENTYGKSLTVSERLHCCIVAFKVMKSNLDALNVDLQDFFVQLYNIILEYRPGRSDFKLAYLTHLSARSYNSTSCFEKMFKTHFLCIQVVSFIFWVECTLKYPIYTCLLVVLLWIMRISFSFHFIHFVVCVCRAEIKEKS